MDSHLLQSCNPLCFSRSHNKVRLCTNFTFFCRGAHSQCQTWEDHLGSSNFVPSSIHLRPVYLLLAPVRALHCFSTRYCFHFTLLIYIFWSCRGPVPCSPTVQDWGFVPMAFEFIGLETHPRLAWLLGHSRKAGYSWRWHRESPYWHIHDCHTELWSQGCRWSAFNLILLSEQVFKFLHYLSGNPFLKKRLLVAPATAFVSFSSPLGSPVSPFFPFLYLLLHQKWKLWPRQEQSNDYKQAYMHSFCPSLVQSSNCQKQEMREVGCWQWVYFLPIRS